MKASCLFRFSSSTVDSAMGIIEASDLRISEVKRKFSWFRSRLALGSKANSCCDFENKDQFSIWFWTEKVGEGAGGDPRESRSDSRAFRGRSHRRSKETSSPLWEATRLRRR